MYGGNNYNQGGGWGQPPPQNNYGGGQPQGQWGQQPPAQYGQGYNQQYGQGNWQQPPQQQQQQGGWGQPPPQQQQWNQQPPQQQQQWGQPSQQQWNQPPQQQQQQWNQPPPQQQQQWNQPPPHQAPPPQQQQWNQAPPQQQQFGAPPASAGGPRFLGVPIPAPPPAPPLTYLPQYDPGFDVDRIRKAAKGWGTDERTIIDTMAGLDAFQIELLKNKYEQTCGKKLEKTLTSELSGWFEYVLVLKQRGPLGGDVWLLNRACKGAGTHEDLLTEILVNRTNEEMYLLKEAYRREYNKDLGNVIRGELSMKTERMFNMVLAGSRDESPHVNHQLVMQDVQTIHSAGPGRVGTDELTICGVFFQRSPAHLRALVQAYPQQHRNKLSRVVANEFSFHMKMALLHVVEFYEDDGNGVARDVNRIEAAMKGMGTKDERLSYRIVRAHWDRPRFGAIKQLYQQTYRTSLVKRVEGETSGWFEKALVAILNMN